MNISNEHEDDIPGTLTIELAPTTRTVVFCFSTWAGEELECVKCTKGRNVRRPSKTTSLLEVIKTIDFTREYRQVKTTSPTVPTSQKRSA